MVFQSTDSLSDSEPFFACATLSIHNLRSVHRINCLRVGHFSHIIIISKMFREAQVQRENEGSSSSTLATNLHLLCTALSEIAIREHEFERGDEETKGERKTESVKFIYEKPSRQRLMTSLLIKVSGTSWHSMRCIRPSMIAVFPTPGSPTRWSLILGLFPRICITVLFEQLCPL
ncbi:hypothetical protein KP509_26G071700 [Ceratopteris richardii]|uniref:Uncharacterized protein n=1 Tax=Ceratopteris richardii TaxID=49495 RepID=A0A8T2RNX8_CERRI|nr:hypothetical protein KP509_26G071700 [Ceratopteris richardii]